MEEGPLALPPEAAGSRTGSAGRAHLRPGSLCAAPRGGQRERPHLTQGRGKGRGSGALSHRRNAGVSTVPGSGSAGAAKAPGHGAPSGRSKGPTRTPGPSHRRVGASRLRGEGGGSWNADPAVSNATVPPRPPPFTAVWSRPVSANQRSPLREEGVFAYPRAGWRLRHPTGRNLQSGARIDQSSSAEAGSARRALSEPAWAGPAGPGGVRDARCGRRRRPRGPPWCEALPR